MELKSTDECLKHVLDDEKLVERIRSAKILLVGAGGIGCEVMKTMILSGFKSFNVIDLDTIDVSNLNRQFLFNKSHVGESKAEVGCKVARERFSHLDQAGYSLSAILDPVQKGDFDVDFFKSHSMVINALDNIAARSHVNRMCLAADVPLIESGTEGYVGQVFVIKKGATSCYECDGPRQAQKTYASCTIRNTPSLPIHCIVWGKHLFAQLFGENDPDNDVSPDVNDPELQNQVSVKNQTIVNDLEHQNQTMVNDLEHQNQTMVKNQTTVNGSGGKEASGQNGNGMDSDQNGTEEGKALEKIPSTREWPERIPSTREWAESNAYDARLLFEKLFDKDIQYLLKMDKLWESRQKPRPLSFADLSLQPAASSTSPSSASSTNLSSASSTNPSSASSTNPSSASDQRPSGTESDLEDQRSWTLEECYNRFAASVEELRKRINPETPFLVWDKDDEPALEFVTAVSNLRSHVFNIERKSKFDVKSMAGNIIPAISSTNAVIGGIITLQAIEILASIIESEGKVASETEREVASETEREVASETEREVASETEREVASGSKCDPEIVYKRCRHVYLKQPSSTVNNLVASYEVSKPNRKCLVCADSREVRIEVDLSECTIGQFTNEVIMNKLGFVHPDIQVDGTSTVIWSKEDADEQNAEERSLSDARILSTFTLVRNGTRLKVYDLIQNLSIILTLQHSKIDPALNDGIFYKVVVISEGTTQQETSDVISKSGPVGTSVDTSVDIGTNFGTSEVFTVEEEDDIMPIDLVALESKNGDSVASMKLKRGSEDVSSIDSPVKKLRT